MIHNTKIMLSDKFLIAILFINILYSILFYEYIGSKISQSPFFFTANTVLFTLFCIARSFELITGRNGSNVIEKQEKIIYDLKQQLTENNQTHCKSFSIYEDIIRRLRDENAHLLTQNDMLRNNKNTFGDIYYYTDKGNKLHTDIDCQNIINSDMVFQTSLNPVLAKVLKNGDKFCRLCKNTPIDYEGVEVFHTKTGKMIYCDKNYMPLSVKNENIESLLVSKSDIDFVRSKFPELVVI